MNPYNTFSVTTSIISFWPLSIPGGDTTSTFSLSSSLQPPPIGVSIGGIGTTTITFPGYTGVGSLVPFYVSGEATPTTTPSMTSIVYYSLPTTVVTSGTVTQTFSEDQITTLSDMSTTTTLTTTWSDKSASSSSSSSTTVVPIWIQTGGFYWSPIPIPGPTPFPIPPIDFPDLPKLPPIPSPPCFKLFGIFSIDCPPDKTKPTTHFTSGPPSPTCTASCGTVDKSNDDESSSTCATETHTACNTVSGTATCRTYIGCECQTSTVTDYWVSCSASSCTTTSSSVVSGCFVTATATTTGAYCPTGVAVSPDDDQDDPAPASEYASETTTQTSEAESVAVSGTPYVVSGGSVVVSGTTLSVPDVTDPVTTTTGGYIVTIWPPYTGPVIVANATITVTDWGSDTGSSSSSSTPISPTPVSSTPISSTPPAPSIAICVGIAYHDVIAPGGAGTLEYQGFGEVGVDGSDPVYKAASLDTYKASDLCGQTVNGQVVTCNGDVSQTCSGEGVATYNGLNCRTICTDSGDPAPCWRDDAGSASDGIIGVIICDQTL